MVSRQPYNPIYFGQAQPRVLNASIRNKGILFATDSKSVSSYLDVDVEVVIQDCDIFYLETSWYYSSSPLLLSISVFSDYNCSERQSIFQPFQMRSVISLSAIPPLK